MIKQYIHNYFVNAGFLEMCLLVVHCILTLQFGFQHYIFVIAMKGIIQP